MCWNFSLVRFGLNGISFEKFKSNSQFRMFSFCRKFSYKIEGEFSILYFFYIFKFKGISCMKNWNSFRNQPAPYLSVSHRGRAIALPKRKHGDERKRVWCDGVGRSSKVPFNFLILRYIKHYTHIYLYSILKIMSRQIYCRFKNLDKLGVRVEKIQNIL